MVDDAIGVAQKYSSSLVNPQNIFIIHPEPSNYFKLSGELRGIHAAEEDGIAFTEGNMFGRLYIYSTSGYNYGLLNRNPLENNINGFMQDTKDWLNVEASCYLKVVNSLSNDSFKIKVRGGEHNGNQDYAGCGLGIELGYDGRIRAVKEMRHPDIMVFSDWINGIGDIENKWIGYKLVVYNIDNNQNVRIEFYIDTNLSNTWEKVFELVDNGSGKFGGQGVMINGQIIKKILGGGPVVTIEWGNITDPDGIILKNISIREIDPKTTGGSNPASSVASLVADERAKFLNLGGVGDQTSISGDSPATANMWGVLSQYATGNIIYGLTSKKDDAAQVPP